MVDAGLIEEVCMSQAACGAHEAGRATYVVGKQTQGLGVKRLRDRRQAFVLVTEGGRKVERGEVDSASGPRDDRRIEARDVTFECRRLGRRRQPRCNLRGRCGRLRGVRRYRYYASSALKPGSGKQPGSLPRIAIGVIDTFIVDRAAPLLAKGWRPEDSQEDRVRHALIRVELSADRVVMIIRREAADAQPHVEHGALQTLDTGLELAIPIRLKHRQGTTLIEGGADPTPSNRVDKPLIRAICLARSWAASLAEGEIASTKQLAQRHGLCNRYAGQLMPLAWLAPDIVEAILAGKQPLALSLGALTKQSLPLDWDGQRKLIAGLG